MIAVHRLITPAGSNMLRAVSTAEERKACPVTEFGFCIGVVIFNFDGIPRTRYIVLRTYRIILRSSYVVRDGMCWTLQPYSTMVVFSHVRYFPLYFWWFIFSFSWRIWYIKCCFETFVHGEVVLIVRVQVKYYSCSIRTTWTAERSTKIPAFPEFVVSVLLLIVGLWIWPEVWSYNQFAGDCTFI